MSALLPRMARLLEAQLTVKRGGQRHLRNCQYGYWIGRYGTATGGQGAPCSPPCARIHAVLAEYQRQPALFEE